MKKVNERAVLLMVFILLAVFALGILFVVNPKFTGFVAIAGYNETECIEAGYVWYNEVCYDEQPICGADFLELCDDTNCEGAGGYWYNDVCNAEECIPDSDPCGNWICGNVENGTCGIISCGTCEEGYICNEGSCIEEPICGNNITEFGEECDDANEVDDDECTNVCELTYCGDGVINRDEVCDDGDGYNGDYNYCKIDCSGMGPYCGDGIVNVTHGEECDDANEVDDDECTNVCELTYCGDGVINRDEVCDDGVNDGTYGHCNDDCLAMGPHCGDGVEDEGEECDDGDNNGEYNYCLADCSGDGPYCGDETCNGDENCDSCVADCACDSGYSCVDGECQASSVITGSVIGCVSNWECGDWSECIDLSQTRTCTDTNACSVETDKPIESQSCTVPETCFDDIKNQDEKGIDCGGVCEARCGFFTIMGNAINVPVNSSKQFIKNNKAISFTILGIILLVVGWILVARFALKKKNIFFFLENLDFLKKMNFFGRMKKISPGSGA